MNDEEIDRYEERRKKHFWEKVFLGLSLALLILGVVGCQPIDTRRDANGDGIPDPYNLSTMGNSTGYVQLIQLVNSNLMNNSFGLLILIAIKVPITTNTISPIAYLRYFPVLLCSIRL